MFGLKSRLLLVLALGVVALAVTPHVLAATSSFDASCEYGEVASGSSESGDVTYIESGFDIAARASQLALRAQKNVDGRDSYTLHFCDIDTSFDNAITVEAGSTGLPEGAPVTLALSVTLQGELEAFYGGAESPDQEPPSWLAEATVSAGFNAWIGDEPVAQFGADGGRREWGNSPDAYYPHGALLDYYHWGWQLTGNRGDTIGDSDSSVSELCPWPVQLPCIFEEPHPEAPDYRGTRTILVNAHVGDTIEVNGTLTILPQAALGIARAHFPGTIAGSGMFAHFAPGPGFDGLRLTQELGAPQAGPTLSIGDASVAEGDNGTTHMSFPVTLSGPVDAPVTVSYSTYDGTATHPSDFAAAGGTLTFAPGELEHDVVIDVVGDRDPEPDETFQVVLNSQVGAAVSDGSGQGTILDDDGTSATPSLTIDDATVVEGSDGTTSVAIPVHISARSRSAVTFDYATHDGTAISPGDYTPLSGTVTIPAGQTGATILVPVVSDLDPEPDETFTVSVENLHGATLSGSGRATVTIADDDACTPTLTYDFVEAKGCFIPDGDSFTARGSVKLNGLDLVPNPGAEIVVDPAHRHVFSRGGYVSIRAGDFEAWKGEFDWHTPLLGPNDTADVDSFLVSPLDLRSLKGLKLAGNIKLQFDLQREARLSVPLGIPLLPVKIDKTLLTGTAILVTDNARGLHSDSLKVTAETLPIPPIMVKRLSISWDELRLRWEGDATVVLPTPTSLQLNAGFAFENGAFAGAHGGADNLNLPLGNGVYVQAIRFGVEFDPLKVSGGLGVSAGPLVAGKTAVRVDGDFAVTFGDPLIVAATGTLKLVDWPLANAYFRYFSTGTVQFGGAVALGLPDMSQPAKQPVRLAAFLNGWVGAGNFAAHGGAEVDVFGIPLVGADALVSNIGAAACGQIAWLKAGFGYRWETGELSVMTGGNCDVGAYSPPIPVGTTTLATTTTAAPAKFQLPKSDNGVVLRLHGDTGTPTVTLTGPGGATVTTPSEDGAPLVNDEFVVMQDEDAKTTIVAIRRPAGTWALTEQQGSPHVTSIEQASIGVDPSVTADVAGDPRGPKLSWRLRAKAGQVVTFVEEADQVDHVITRTSDAKGSVSFTPADGPAGSRDIVAIVEQDGMPRLRTTVAHYEAPDPDDDQPDDPLARKRLGELKRSVVRAGLEQSVERRLVGTLRVARRALGPPTPDTATACARVGDFVVEIGETGGIPAAKAQEWMDGANAVRNLLRCS